MTVVVVIENGLALIRLGIFFAFRNHHRRRNCVRELTHKTQHCRVADAVAIVVFVVVVSAAVAASINRSIRT